MNRAMTVEDVMEIGAELRRRAIVSAWLDELSDELRKQAVANATPEERLAGLAPEDRLAGLTPDEMSALLKQIESLLSRQPAARPSHRKRSGR